MTKENENRIIEQLAGMHDLNERVNNLLEAFADVPADAPAHEVRAMLDAYKKPRH